MLADKCVPPPESPVKVSCGSAGEAGEGGAFNSRNATPSHGQHGDVQSSRARSRGARSYICATPPGGRHPRRGDVTGKRNREVVADWPNGGPIPILSARTPSHQSVRFKTRRLRRFPRLPVLFVFFFYSFSACQLVLKMGSNREDTCSWRISDFFYYYFKIFVL